MSRKYAGRNIRDLDVDDFNFGRPKKRSRPRTKVRPDYSDAEIGRVITIGRGRYQCVMESTGNLVIAAKARQLGRKGVIVGDKARVVGDTSGKVGTLARIVEIVPRQTVLRRTADDDSPLERPIVANADQLLIVTALADPPPREGMIDRILVSAYDAGMKPILCLTKADLASPQHLIDTYAPLDLTIFVVGPDVEIDELLEALAGHVTVFIGHSGVGKSTLINRIVPNANRQTGSVNENTGRGRHTSTSAQALRLPDSEGWVIDTPGVRSFGLSHVTPESVLAAFSGLAEYLDLCPRGCTHETGESECGLDKALQDEAIDENRLVSLRRILEALQANDVPGS